MEITSERAMMLIDLREIIKSSLGYELGYSHPYGSFTSDQDDFILFDILDSEDSEPEQKQTEPLLLARGDFIRHEHGIFTEEGKRKYPLHDDKVEKFLQEVDQALLDGRLYFDPEVEKIIDSVKFIVRKKVDNRFSVRIIRETQETGFCRTLEEIQRDSNQFNILKTRNSLDSSSLSKEKKAKLINLATQEQWEYTTLLKIIKEEWPENFKKPIL